MGNMKDSGIEWIGMIPSDWEICRIKDKYQLITGFTPDTARDDFYDDENGYTWISIADMTKEGKNISESSAGISDIYVRSKHPEIVKKGSLLYSFKLSVGKVGFAQKELYTNEAIASFQENSDICLEYLYYAAFLIEENANINIYGAKILNQDLINNSVTIFPPMPEQQLIADFLDDKVGKIDDILSDLRKQVETLHKYKKSVITKVVTKGLDSSAPMKDSGIEWIGEIPEHWNCKKLKYVLNNPLMYGANESGEDFDENYPRYIRITDIDEDNKLKEDGKLSLLPEIAKPYILKDGDILFARSGATVGKTYLYKKEDGVAAFAGYLIKADINEELSLPEYVYFSTLGVGYDNWKNSVFTQATIQNIGADKYSTYIIPIPTLDEQKDIVNYLRDKCFKIDELIKDKEAQIEKMEKYKKSLIYEYVTGKKRVKGAE